MPQQSPVAVKLLSPNIVALKTGKYPQLADSIAICCCGPANKTEPTMPQMLAPNGRRMSTMSTQDQDTEAASLHTIMTGSNETIISANKSMFFLEMNPFAPVSVVLLHMLCKVPVKSPPSPLPPPPSPPKPHRYHICFRHSPVVSITETGLQGQLATLLVTTVYTSVEPEVPQGSR